MMIPKTKLLEELIGSDREVLKGSKKNEQWDTQVEVSLLIRWKDDCMASLIRSMTTGEKEDDWADSRMFGTTETTTDPMVAQRSGSVRAAQAECWLIDRWLQEGSRACFLSLPPSLLPCAPFSPAARC